MALDPLTAAAIEQAKAARTQALAAVWQAIAATILIVATVVSAIASWLQNKRAEAAAEARSIAAETRADKRLALRHSREKELHLKASKDVLDMVFVCLTTMSSKATELAKSLQDITDAGATDITRLRQMWVTVSDHNRRSIRELSIPSPPLPQLILLRDLAQNAVSVTTECRDAESPAELRSAVASDQRMISVALEKVEEYRGELKVQIKALSD